VVNQITSQIDLPITLLSLAGIQGRHPMIGQDMSQLYVLQPNQQVFYGKYNFDTYEIIENKNTSESIERPLAYAILPSILYSERLYKLPPQ